MITEALALVALVSLIVIADILGELLRETGE